MSASIIEHRMESTHVDGQLDNREMKVFDYKAEVHHKLNWSSRDRGFSRIERSMREKRVAPGEVTATTSSRGVPRSATKGTSTRVRPTAGAICWRSPTGFAGNDRIEQFSRRFPYLDRQYYMGDTDPP